MKKLFVSILAIGLMAAGTTVNAQQTVVEGSKTYTTKKVNVDSFKHLVLTGSPDVVYTQTNSGKPQVEIYGPDNLVALLETNVEDNKLIIKFKENTSVRHKGKFEVRVSAPEVKSMEVKGSGDITLANTIKTTKLSLSVQGSGDIEGKKLECEILDLSVQGSGDIKLENIKSTDLKAQVAGSGDIELGGSSKSASYRVNGSGDIKATDLKAEDVQANVNGSGNIRCHATKALKGSVNGSGTVRYKGNPEISFSKKGLKKL